MQRESNKIKWKLKKFLSARLPLNYTAFNCLTVNKAIVNQFVSGKQLICKQFICDCKLLVT